MKKLLLHEDMFFDIPNVDYKLDTELELKGPEPGEDVGVSGLLLDLIGDVAKNINDYNQLQANLENYPEVAGMIKDFADEENMKLGKIQSALKTISPNAEYIMNGAVEAEEEMDPSSPLDESLKESFNEGFDPKDYNQALDDYMHSKNISVEKLFGALNYDDPRYIQLFNSLNDLGYKPRETGTYSRGYFVPAMTITLATREVPDDVVDLIHDLNGVTGRHIEFHKGAHNWKLKFELRDDDFSSFKDELLQSLDESLNESVGDVDHWISIYLKNHPFDNADEMIEYISEYEDIDALEDRFKTDVIGAIEDYFEDNLNESLSSNDGWEEYYDSDLQRRFYFISASGGKGEITYQDNDGNGYYRCAVWLNRRTHKFRTFNVTTSLKDAKEKVETLIDKYSDSKQESLDNEYWDSSRAYDLATYCWDKGYDEDKAYQVTVAQLKKEGSALPKDLDRVKTVIYDYYDEQSDGEDDFLDESYGLYEMARVKRPNPENMKMLDSGYCNAYEWKAEKQKQISKYKKQYPGVKCELVKTDTPGLRMWMTYIEEE